MSDLIAPETMGFLERVVRDPSIDVNKLDHIIALQERVATREAERGFAVAMNALQAEMPQIHKDAINPHARSRYATYESIDAIIRPLYTRHGFSVRFTTRSSNGRIRVGCTVSHVSGHSESEHELESGPDMTGSKGQVNKTEVQGVGSIVSYLKRYTLMAAFAVALQDDETEDDGEATRPDPLDEKNGTLWLKNFLAACDAATSITELQRINNHPSTLTALKDAPKLIKGQISDKLNATFKRLNPAKRDPKQVMLEQIKTMDLIALEEIPQNALWTSRLAELFPPDADEIHQTIEARKQELQHAGS